MCHKCPGGREAGEKALRVDGLRFKLCGIVAVVCENHDFALHAMTQVTDTSMLPKPPRKEYSAGNVISDKYRLLQLLGEGGMGSVWVAENMALKANVALKLIRADVAETSANERFLSEARLAARLQHSAIVRVFDFGKTEHDEPFIVMELLDGETLGHRLTRLGSIDPTELVQMVLPIIDALHSAHGHGVIHRDLKPDNVFIAKAAGGGVQPKLLDFGIAKLRGEGTFHKTKLTQAGTLIGSPDYMSPEQARGETDLDPRSDVWALCVLAYECLVGKPPFHGDNYNALLWSIIHDEPVPITVFQAGDSELWRILKTGFAKDRNERWENARQLGEALAQWLDNHGVTEDACNRSLHASWLPAERPTRPELAPFDPRAMSHEPDSSHTSLVPPQTMTALRRPHTMSLWFAGLGLLTLVGAYVVSEAREQQAGTISGSPTGSAAAPVPSPVVRALTPPNPDGVIAAPAGTPAGVSAPVVHAAAGAPDVAVAPAAETAPRSSWTDNYGTPSRARDAELADAVRKGVRGETDESSPSASSPRHRNASAAKPRAAKSSSAKPSSVKASELPLPRARVARPSPRKEPVEIKTEPEVDFGI
jgi:eukaryotic-like serine/threonine-protein kinase